MASFGSIRGATEEGPIATAIDVLVSSQAEPPMLSSNSFSAKVQACYSLMSLVTEHKTHAMDLLRKGNGKQGILPLTEELLKFSENDEDQDVDEEYITVFIQLLACACDYVEFTVAAVHVEGTHADTDTVTDVTEQDEVELKIYRKDLKKLSFTALICLLRTGRARSSATGEALLILLLRILKNLPIMKPEEKKGTTEIKKKVETEEEQLYLSDEYIKLILSILVDTIRSSECLVSTKMMAIAFISGFLSDVKDYVKDDHGSSFQNVKDENDVILRKKVTFRSKHHSKIAIDMNILQSLISYLAELAVSDDGGDSFMKQQLLVFLVSVVNDVSDDNLLKDTIFSTYANCAVDYNSTLTSQTESFIERGYAQIVLLLSNRSDIAQWLLGNPGGIDQLIMLVSSNVENYQEVAAEILCLASSMEATTFLFSGMIENGFLSQLLSSPSPIVQTAAAAAMTKLSIRAKAFKNDSPEIPELLRISVGTIKSMAKRMNISTKDGCNNKKIMYGESDLISLERALEVLAALSIRTHVKEELINGSTRCVSIIPHLWDICGENGPLTSLGVGETKEGKREKKGKIKSKSEGSGSGSGGGVGDHSNSVGISTILKCDTSGGGNESENHRRSTALFAITHILSNLTVTNEELRSEMLRDKEITPEEHRKLQEIQRIKTKDENGNIIEENQDDTLNDDDNEAMCRERIKKLATKGALNFMVRILSSTSKNVSMKAVDVCTKTFCQMVREESIRGQVVQQGIVGMCCKIANGLPPHANAFTSTRLSAAHVVARTCITTNPNLLPTHTRLDTIKPLLMILTHKDSLQIQQFEALLSLTNVLSVGIEEQDKFSSNKGVYIVHNHMYSENLMIRRAAVEVFCNMASHKELLKLLNGDVKRIRFWMVLMENWDGDGESRDVTQQGNFECSPCYFTARAAVGTLAMSVDDVEITKKICIGDSDGDCSKAVQSLLASQEPELILRALVMIQTMTGSHGYDDESLTFIARDMSAGVARFNAEDTAKINIVLKEWDDMKLVRVQAIQFLFEHANIMELLQNLVEFAQSKEGIKRFESIGGTGEIMSLVQDIVGRISEMMQALGFMS